MNTVSHLRISWLLTVGIASIALLSGCNKLGYGEPRTAPEGMANVAGPKRLPAENAQQLQKQSEVIATKQAYRRNSPPAANSAAYNAQYSAPPAAMPPQVLPNYPVTQAPSYAPAYGLGPQSSNYTNPMAAQSLAQSPSPQQSLAKASPYDYAPGSYLQPQMTPVGAYNSSAPTEAQVTDYYHMDLPTGAAQPQPYYAQSQPYATQQAYNQPQTYQQQGSSYQPAGQPVYSQPQSYPVAATQVMPMQSAEMQQMSQNISNQGWITPAAPVDQISQYDLPISPAGEFNAGFGMEAAFGRYQAAAESAQNYGTPQAANHNAYPEAKPMQHYQPAPSPFDRQSAQESYGQQSQQDNDYDNVFYGNEPAPMEEFYSPAEQSLLNQTAVPDYENSAIYIATDYEDLPDEPMQLHNGPNNSMVYPQGNHHNMDYNSEQSQPHYSLPEPNSSDYISANYPNPYGELPTQQAQEISEKVAPYRRPLEVPPMLDQSQQARPHYTVGPDVILPAIPQL